MKDNEPFKILFICIIIYTVLLIKSIKIDTDCQAQLLAPHMCLSKHLQINNKNGHFLLFLTIGLSWTEELGIQDKNKIYLPDIDSENNLYLSFSNGTVRKLQYMSHDREEMGEMVIVMKSKNV